MSECVLIHVRKLIYTSYLKSNVFYNEANQEELSPLQCQILSQSAKKVKDTATRLATEHKELHGGISKIGKAIDRVSFIQSNFVKIWQSFIIILKSMGGFMEPFFDVKLCQQVVKLLT
jgi:hypothetical protein